MHPKLLGLGSASHRYALRRIRGTKPPYFFFGFAFGSGASACGSKPT
jgi:hypothetical protein